MKHQRLKNLVILVTAVAYFAATFLGQQMRLRILYEKLPIISQRFFGIPPFRFYALADGIRRILSRGTFCPPEIPPASLQLELTPRLRGLKDSGETPVFHLIQCRCRVQVDWRLPFRYPVGCWAVRERQALRR